MDGNKRREYLKFSGVMLGIVVLSWLWTLLSFFDQSFMYAFMGVFFVVFAGFKLSNLKMFAHGFQNYDLIAKRSLAYAFSYPFMQLLFGLLYLSGVATTLVHMVALVVSVVSGVGVLQKIRAKEQVHCLCLGNVIKLPLSSVTLIEDFGMAAMAIFMIALV